jgi:hypothetical protein
MNIFYYDTDKYSYTEAKSYFNSIVEKFGDTVALPKNSCLLVDCDLEGLKIIRDMIDKAIKKKEEKEGA